MLNIADVFGWVEQAAQGGLDVLNTLANGASSLIINNAGETPQLNTLGVLIIAGVGAPLAWKFIKYLISLFNKVKPN